MVDTAHFMFRSCVVTGRTSTFEPHACITIFDILYFIHTNYC